MCSIGRSVCINHEIGIAMIGGYEYDIVISKSSCYDPFNTPVNRFYCFYNGLEIACMTHHVRIGKIQANKI